MSRTPPVPSARYVRPSTVNVFKKLICFFWASRAARSFSPIKSISFCSFLEVSGLSGTERPSVPGMMV
ncbi:MAG: hypothetical protein A2Z83_08230 [Omnitrophica bacterium GWA2_52_8]|nr:MAG: hypothetical protein A2Z83_08230 [Omnitrophica bacterium GWA2_52_8]